MNLKDFVIKNPFTNVLYFGIAKRGANQLLSKREQWADIQLDRLVELLVYARDHSKYYSKFLNNKVINSSNVDSILRELPLLSKDIIREQQFNIYSNEILHGRIIWGNTGGSTGEPLKFPRLTNRQWNEPIHQFITYSYLAGEKGVNRADRIVSISGERITEERLKNNLFFIGGRNFPYGGYKFSTLYMNEENLPYYIESINKIKPSFIRAYSAGALTLAQYIKNHSIKLHFQLKGIYLTSEAFSENSRKFISDVFHCPVIGQYGHTEMSVYAIQHIDDSVYECMPLYGYTELLDDQGNRVKEGEIGEIVVSGFNQIGLPFIRYKTGDLAIYKGVKNGIVCIDAIQGRTVDFLYDNDGNKVFLTGAIFGGHIRAFNHIDQWQLIQKEIGKVGVEIIKGDGFNEEIEKEVLCFFEQFGVEASINYVSSIKKQSNGKQKFLLQEIHS